MTPTWLTGLLIAVLCHTWTSRKYNITCLSAFGGLGMCGVCCFALLRIVGDIFIFFSLYWISFYSPCHFLGNHLRGSNNDAKLNILHIFFSSTLALHHFLHADRLQLIWMILLGKFIAVNGWFWCAFARLAFFSCCWGCCCWLLLSNSCPVFFGVLSD